MSSKTNFASLFHLTIGGPPDPLLLFNLLSDCLASETLDRLLEAAKRVYYGGSESEERREERGRVVELVGFVCSELFFILLHEK